VVNVGSLFGDGGTPLQSTYGSVKDAVHGFTDSLRMELAYHDEPIAVMLVHPGRIDTPYNEHAQSYLDHQPAHHGGVYPPDAVAQAIVYSAAHVPRDMFVGSQAKITALARALFPRLTDWYMEHQMWPLADGPTTGRRRRGTRQTPPSRRRRRCGRRATGCTSAAPTGLAPPAQLLGPRAHPPGGHAGGNRRWGVGAARHPGRPPLTAGPGTSPD
jgi:short chain dehydrogenase